jgi:hypothetical protein
VLCRNKLTHSLHLVPDEKLILRIWQIAMMLDLPKVVNKAPVVTEEAFTDLNENGNSLLLHMLLH